MVNPENEAVFCPLINEECKGRNCIAMKKQTYHWTTEGCMGGEEHHNRIYFQCVHYPDIKIWTEERW